MQRVHLVISGDVQGIGYRAWVLRQAQDLRVFGWVKNREDGSVEIIAEGTKESLEEMVRRCAIGPEVALVKDVVVEWSDGTGEFIVFEILH